MGQKCITRTLFETMIPRCGIYSKIWFGQMFFVVLESWMCINLSLFFCFQYYRSGERLRRQEEERRQQLERELEMHKLREAETRERFVDNHSLPNHQIPIKAK